MKRMSVTGFGVYCVDRRTDKRRTLAETNDCNQMNICIGKSIER